ncbi:protein lin-12-like isoform X2 [Antedon mediterranea]|uniref:protein lin-12-like isoform X2 n=1 Tax=Antedon mediterranea TaxID=105859 RepID=UPI003AF74FF7
MKGYCFIILFITYGVSTALDVRKKYRSAVRVNKDVRPNALVQRALYHAPPIDDRPTTCEGRCGRKAESDHEQCYCDSNCQGLSDDCCEDYSACCMAHHSSNQVCGVDSCVSNPCLNGGTCTDASHHYVCECPSGWHGVNCDEIAVSCTDKPCDNNGVCSEGADGINVCKCPPEWEGDHCQYRKPRPTISCEDRCGLPIGHVEGMCYCDTACKVYRDCCSDYGACCLELEQKQQNVCGLNSCESTPCVKGTCIDGDNSFECECDSGWHGERCDIINLDCSGEPSCGDGGKCAVGYGCVCDIGFTGPRCEPESLGGESKTNEELASDVTR